MNPQLAIGNVVVYRLTASDCDAINRRRTSGQSIHERLQQEPPAWPEGAQAHIGNQVHVGQVVPFVVTAVWPEEFDGKGGYNGQVLLDGTDSLWVTSVQQGMEPGNWNFA